ncbi:hypothetical protein K501DRAFT_274212 [Backusella circina FSU 941]|nr:hypothetical protein K501DRAFT_274212 [Backusella circina FSU 941]
MKRLPIEICQAIFSNLDQKSKAICMTVCKKWAQLIKLHCLFQTIHLTTYHNVVKLMKRFELEPYHTLQVENLIIDHCQNNRSLIDLNQLLTMLPNIRVLYIHSKSHCFHVADPLEQPWSKSIQKLIIGDQIFAFRFFACNTFNNLKVLVLNGRHMPTQSILCILSKAPALVDLRLAVYWISILDIEELHSTLPMLVNFVLQLNHLSNDELPVHIQPIPLVKSVGIVYTGNSYISNRLSWFKYLSQKYIKISEIQYQEQSILDSFGRNGVMITSEIEQRFGLFIQQLGPKSKKLDLKAQAVPLSLFSMMDQTGIQCSSLSIESEELVYLVIPFIKSDQIHHIQKLQLGKLNTVHLPWLSNLSDLKELSLHFNVNDDLSADIQFILYLCPQSLESLELRHIRLTSINQPYKVYPLRCLRIFNSELDRGVDLYLGQSLPKLCSLSLMYCILHDKRLALPKISLSNFKIGLDGEQHWLNIVIYTSKDRKKRMYMAKDDDTDWHLLNGHRQTDEYPFHNPLNPFVVDSEKHPQIAFTLECESVKDVFAISQTFTKLVLPAFGDNIEIEIIHW